MFVEHKTVVSCGIKSLPQEQPVLPDRCWAPAPGASKVSPALATVPSARLSFLAWISDSLITVICF